MRKQVCKEQELSRFAEFLLFTYLFSHVVIIVWLFLYVLIKQLIVCHPHCSYVVFVRFVLLCKSADQPNTIFSCHTQNTATGRHHHQSCLVSFKCLETLAAATTCHHTYMLVAISFPSSLLPCIFPTGSAYTPVQQPLPNIGVLLILQMHNIYTVI